MPITIGMSPGPSEGRAREGNTHVHSLISHRAELGKNIYFIVVYIYIVYKNIYSHIFILYKNIYIHMCAFISTLHIFYIL